MKKMFLNIASLIILTIISCNTDDDDTSISIPETSFDIVVTSGGFGNGLGLGEVLRFSGEDGSFIGPFPDDITISNQNIKNSILTISDLKDEDGKSLSTVPTKTNLGPDGLLYIIRTTNGQIIRVDPITGEFIDIFIEFEGLNGQALTFIPSS